MLETIKYFIFIKHESDLRYMLHRYSSKYFEYFGIKKKCGADGGNSKEEVRETV